MSKLFVVVGPSGAGKDTLLAAVVAACPEVYLVRRVITRPAEAGGEAHEAADIDSFLQRAERGDFAAAWTAHGLSYGIPKRELESGAAVTVFNGSRAALPEILTSLPDARVIEITASDDVLAQRLALRGRETAEDILARLRRARFSAPMPTKDVIRIENDGALEDAAAQLKKALIGD